MTIIVADVTLIGRGGGILRHVRRRMSFRDRRVGFDPSSPHRAPRSSPHSRTRRTATSPNLAGGGVASLLPFGDVVCCTQVAMSCLESIPFARVSFGPSQRHFAGYLGSVVVGARAPHCIMTCDQLRSSRARRKPLCRRIIHIAARGPSTPRPTRSTGGHPLLSVSAVCRRFVGARSLSLPPFHCESMAGSPGATFSGDVGVGQHRTPRARCSQQPVLLSTSSVLSVSPVPPTNDMRPAAW